MGMRRVTESKIAEQQILPLKTLIRNRVSRCIPLHWSVITLNLRKNVHTYTYICHYNSSVIHGSKFYLNSFEFRRVSRHNGVPEDRFIFELGPKKSAIQDQKADESGEGRCNVLDQTLLNLVKIYSQYTGENKACNPIKHGDLLTHWGRDIKLLPNL
jgi:hypothetical protein